MAQEATMKQQITMIAIRRALPEIVLM